MVNYRIFPETENLKKEHYRLGFGIDSDLLNKVNNARIEANLNGAGLKTRDDFHEVYDKRSGYYIDGTKIKTKEHDLHKKSLYDTHKNRYYIIDSVNYQYYFGKYMIIMARSQGTLSHAMICFENISCKEPDTVKKIESNIERYKLVDLYDDSEELAENERLKEEKWSKK